MSDVIDLGALIPQAVTVKFGDQEVLVTPPKTADILKLGYLGQKLQDGADLSDEAIDELVEKLDANVKRCIPKFSDKQLNLAQLLKLVDIINDMAMPPDAKELAKRGITAATPKKAQ